jgi:vancomycin resistance protein VanJ
MVAYERQPGAEPPLVAGVGDRMRRWFLLALVAVPAEAIPSGPLVAASGDLRIATYNVNYGLAGDPATLAALVATGADVVFVQEATPEWAAVFAGLSAYPYQRAVDHGGAGGLAILSRFPFDDVAVVPSPVGWFPAWCVIVHAPSGDLQALTLHLHPPFDDRFGFVLGPFTTGDERDDEMVAAMAALDPGLPTIVVGDFNERRGAAVRRLEDAGFEDAVHAWDPGRTWRWPVGPLTLHGTFDHVFVRGIAAVGADVLEAGNSDHLPVAVELVTR